MPRAGLSRELVVTGAAGLADEVGLERLTLAAVAAHFDVRQPSLYQHVDGLEGLRRDLALLGLREMYAALASATVGKSRGEALRALADAFRAWAKAHPGRYAATVRAPELGAPASLRTGPAGATTNDPRPGPYLGDAEHQAASDAVVGVVLAVLAGYGLEGAEAIHAARCLRSALHGFVSLEAAGGFGMPHSVDASYRALVDVLDRSFSGGTGLFTEG